jgi:16S rRNA (uracil1498-N3)-methyltransferase
MPRYDFRTPRLFVEPDSVLAFNGRDGEWRAALRPEGRKSMSLELAERTRVQDRPADQHYLFAPLKHARLDYMVQKAVELGASRLQPVVTRHTQAARVNLDRRRANAIEAAEQCGILNLCEVVDAMPLLKVLGQRSSDRVLVFCDEDAETRDPVAALSGIGRGTPLAVLIGPEGGFASEERELLLREKNSVRLALGPRILRADTAAVAALALVQTVVGDWG